MRTGRRSILTLWLIGVLAAAQLAKMAILAPHLATRVGFSIAEAGLLISLLEIGGALFGFVAGLLLGRIGARTSLLAGLVVLTLTGLAETHATGAMLLLAARAVEGLGYLMVVIAAPTLITAIAAERDRAASLALWSTFVAAGLAAGSAVTGLAYWMLGLRGALQVWPALCVLGLVAAARLPIACSRNAVGGIALPAPAAWIATMGFGFYTACICALTMLLPTFLIERAGASAGIAGLLTGVVALGSTPGASIAIALSRTRWLDRKRTVATISLTLAVAAAAGPWAFISGPSAGSTMWASTAVALWIASFGGIASPIVFGRLPMLAGARSPTDPRIAAANGLITQFGAGGALLGPPVGGLVVLHWGWEALGLLVGALALATLCALTAAEHLAARAKAQGFTAGSTGTTDKSGQRAPVVIKGVG